MIAPQKDGINVADSLLHGYHGAHHMLRINTCRWVEDPNLINTGKGCKTMQNNMNKTLQDFIRLYKTG
jgi:hypothetical protein